MKETENKSVSENGLKIIPTKQATELLNKSTTTLWRYRQQGLLTFRRIGGTVGYLASDIEKFLENSKRN